MFLKPLYEFIYIVGWNNSSLPDDWKKKNDFILRGMESIYKYEKENEDAPAFLLECFVELYLIAHLFTSTKDKETKFKKFVKLFATVTT